MARRFALALVALLALLLGAFLVARRLAPPRPAAPAAPPPRPTAVVPPTPIPARPVTLWFESSDGDGALHPELRHVPAASDDVAFLKSVAAGVVEGPRSPDLVKPLPDGWSLRAAYLLREGVAVLDLAPPRPAPETDAAGPPAAVRWQAGAHEEDTAVQALAVTIAKNMPAVTRILLLVGGEPGETLAGHVDLGHPIAPDLPRAADEPARAAPPPTPTPTISPTPTETPSKSPAKKPAARPSGVTA